MDFLSILGIVAGSFTTASYVPQGIKILKSKESESISKRMYILLIIGGILWLIYGITTESTPVIIANSISLIFSVVILLFKVIYK